MNLYSKKLNWKIALALLAFLITGGFLWYSSYISGLTRFRNEQELEKWSLTIVKQAEVVKLTNQTFEQLKTEEQRKAKIWVRATKEFENDLPDYALSTELRDSIKIPLIMLDEHSNYASSFNLSIDENAKGFKDSIAKYIIAWQTLNEPLHLTISGFNYQIIYNNSNKYYALTKKRDSLINSFNEDLSANTGLVPFIFVDSATNNLLATNIKETNLEINSRPIDKMKIFQAANQPIRIDLGGGEIGYIYHDVDPLQQQLLFYPYIQLGIIGLFILIGYLLFSTFRRAEQNQVWAGMAKETAHQLGTPLSSLMAWMELLKEQGVDIKTVQEMNKDVRRLETITERFSKIGSETQLTEANVVEVINSITEYLRNRISTKVVFNLPDQNNITAQMNAPLFEWVVENITKNAVDSMGGKGAITFMVSATASQVQIDISDTGKGIPTGKLKTVFEPGFTTKKRGWGLGLSLAKRIIENYHHGKIFVANSELNKGTTFRILLNQ
ncbi:MAG: HAMP domain-containing histidine kinase [Crocinitomicaceae bacterium]|jgi:signal transduction histidine kinase|nr:HAMP domain-containing histidine kinase [Crocinitomicaceae bacterium]MBT6514749.1 HAMP domain-containing histidine kinase [Crocinitomicaceae bacterium]